MHAAAAHSVVAAASIRPFAPLSAHSVVIDGVVSAVTLLHFAFAGAAAPTACTVTAIAVQVSNKTLE